MPRTNLTKLEAAQIGLLAVVAAEYLIPGGNTYKAIVFLECALFLEKATASFYRNIWQDAAKADDIVRNYSRVTLFGDSIGPTLTNLARSVVSTLKTPAAAPAQNLADQASLIVKAMNIFKR